VTLRDPIIKIMRLSVGALEKASNLAFHGVRKGIDFLDRPRTPADDAGAAQSGADDAAAGAV
jgi:hypothetical protein